MAIKITGGNKIALLFGATGLVGSRVLSRLLLSDNYKKVVVFSRKEVDISNPKLIQHLIDFDQLDNYKKLIKGDDLFCCLGTTIKKAGSKEAFRKVDFEYITNIAILAAKNKVNQFLLVSSIGADEEGLFFYSQVKGETENALSKLNFWGLHIFRPSVLLGARNEDRWGEEIAKTLGIVLDRFLGDKLAKYRPINSDRVAKAMVFVAQRLQSGHFVYPNEKIDVLADEKWLDEEGLDAFKK